MSLTIVIPALNEAESLQVLAPVLASLDPRPEEILLVDGGSSDATVQIAEQLGWRVMEAEQGRAKQINAGVAAAKSDMICVLHADTLLPLDAAAVIGQVLADDRIALASFTPLIKGPHKTRWFTTFHNWIKTWYAPLITRPHHFMRGVRLLFGDHAMFFRRAQFLAIGGCTPSDNVMEEADLCVKFADLGRIKMVPRFAETSDRRIAEWGPLKANWIYFKVGMMWAFGMRDRMAENYPDVR